LIANLEKHPSQFSERDQELIVHTAVNRAIAATQDVKSEPFRAGAYAELARKLFGKRAASSPYPKGSPSRDAWLAGAQYGNQIARIIHDGGWKLFLESTAA
jgi:hypothetical protein